MDLDCYLIEQLNNKFIKRPVMIDRLVIANLKDHSPQDFFPDESNASSIKECYILTPRRLLYGVVIQPNRRPRINGYWKPLGYTDGMIFGRNGEVGVKHQLCFFRGEPHNRQKTHWKMIEYRVLEHCCKTECDHPIGRLDEWVLCKVYEDFDPEALSSQMEMMNID